MPFDQRVSRCVGTSVALMAGLLTVTMAACAARPEPVPGAAVPPESAEVLRVLSVETERIGVENEYFSALRNEAGAARNRAAIEGADAGMRAYYREHAGIYLREDEDEASVGARLLQILTWSREDYSWGRDLRISRTFHGILDYSAYSQDFEVDTGSGGPNPIAGLQKNGSSISREEPMLGWRRVSSPEEPSWFIRDLVLRRQEAYEAAKELFLPPGEAYAAVAASLEGLLRAWKAEDREAFASFLPRGDDLRVESGTETSLGAAELRSRRVSAYGERPVFLGDDLDLQARLLFEEPLAARIFPNLFMNAEPSAWVSYGKDLALVELLLYFEHRDGMSPNSDRLSFFFVREGSDWKILRIVLDVDMI